MRARDRLRDRRQDMSLMNQFQSRIVINIELPSPVKRFYEFYLATMEVLTGEKKATWEEFVTGEKVSKLTMKLKFMFCVLLYTSTIVIALQAPSLLPRFWTISYLFLHYSRYEVFAHSNPRGTFFLIDYCYYAALLMAILFNVPGLTNNSSLYATVFALETGASLHSVVAMPGVNSLTFGSKSSLSHMQLVYLHFVPSFVLFIDLMRKRLEEPWVFNEITSRHTDGQSMLLKHFVYPGVAIVIWMTLYLCVTEGIYYRKIYHSNPPYFTQTNYNLGYFRPKRAKGLQKTMEKFLKKIFVLRSDVRFKPERRYAHHLTAIVLYNICSFLVQLCLLPLSFFFLKNLEIFGIYLLALFLVVVHNGSEKMVYENRSLKRTPTLALKTRKKSEALSESTTDTEDLDEGGSLNDRHWTKDLPKLVEVEEGVATKAGDKIKEQENNSSAENDSNKTALEETESLPKPVPLSQSKVVDKDI